MIFIKIFINNIKIKFSKKEENLYLCLNCFVLVKNFNTLNKVLIYLYGFKIKKLIF